jgi:hypothetical protein
MAILVTIRVPLEYRREAQGLVVDEVVALDLAGGCFDLVACADAVGDGVDAVDALGLASAVFDQTGPAFAVQELRVDLVRYKVPRHSRLIAYEERQSSWWSTS